MSRRALGWGALVVGVYLATAAATSRTLPIRPLFDGLAPPVPYRWVNPPADLKADNQKPEAAEQDLALKPEGNEEASVATLDAQATLIVPQGVFVSTTGDKSVHIEVTPRDPAQYGPPPPRLQYSGNAYELHATFQPSGAQAIPSREITVLLSHPVHATKIFLRDADRWTELATTTVPAALQVFAKTRLIGPVVAAGPATSSALRWWTLGVASGIAAVLGVAFGIRERRRLARTAQ